jgi:tetratricopeptide (TPR) repeat protein
MDCKIEYRYFGRKISAAAGFWLLFVCTAGMAESIFGDDDFNKYTCAPTNYEGRKDYRLRESTAQLRWAANDTYQSHVAPALRRMQQGDFSKAVIGDLNFTLHRWPNHYPALQALISFEVGGGPADRFQRVSCYFQRAHWFVPDDAQLIVLNGVYRHKNGDYEAAEESWKYALALDSNSAEAHYNLGLLYFRREDFSSAVEHARFAYELGYPLPGLKNKLIENDYWEK